ncbi:MAG: YbaK/EbsC family protein [Desulfovibrionaceae bacterium]|nr:YbaK/EbsC family protein [Desulfovibrionaceae bacterium]
MGYALLAMSVESVRKYLDYWGKGGAVREFPTSSATVELAALALGVEGRRIAKTLCFRGDKSAPHAGGAVFMPVILLVAAGDARVDSAVFKARFGLKASMLGAEEVLAQTGHGVGGVCPFDLPNPLVQVYLDVSLQRFATVFPACGSANSAVELDCEELFAMSRARDWVDVCKSWREEIAP